VDRPRRQHQAVDRLDRDDRVLGHPRVERGQLLGVVADAEAPVPAGRPPAPEHDQARRRSAGLDDRLAGGDLPRRRGCRQQGQVGSAQVLEERHARQQRSVVDGWTPLWGLAQRHG
jgi:hypothetical protein